MKHKTRNERKNLAIRKNKLTARAYAQKSNDLGFLPVDFMNYK
jgi:hypothetical protein